MAIIINIKVFKNAGLKIKKQKKVKNLYFMSPHYCTFILFVNANSVYYMVYNKIYNKNKYYLLYGRVHSLLKM